MSQKQNSLKSIAEILGDTKGRLRISKHIRRYKLWELWPDIVGREIAAHARPARWYGRTLVVRVEHPAWIQELGFLKPQMIEKICSAVPEAKLKDIKYEVGTLPPMPQIASEQEARKPCKLDEDEKEFIDQASGEISDPEVREAAKKAMNKSFAAIKAQKKDPRIRHK